MDSELWLPFADLVRQLVMADGDIQVSIPPDIEAFVHSAAFEKLGASSVQVETALSFHGRAETQGVVYYGASGPMQEGRYPSVHILTDGLDGPCHSVDEKGLRHVVLTPRNSADRGGLAAPGTVELAIAAVLSAPSFLERHFLITAGPTVEDIDPVRFISNRSSGKMGLALAEAAVIRGAQVTLIHGPMRVDIPDYPGLTAVPVRSASSMYDRVMAGIAECDVAIMCAAVADFTPATVASQKIKKETGALACLTLERTPDILAAVGRLDRRPLLAGFAAETDNVAGNALAKLERKNCDLLCANDVSEAGSGFGSDTNRITIYRRGEPDIALPMLTKEAAAARIMDVIQNMLP